MTRKMTVHPRTYTDPTNETRAANGLPPLTPTERAQVLHYAEQERMRAWRDAEIDNRVEGYIHSILLADDPERAAIEVDEERLRDLLARLVALEMETPDD